MYGNYGEHLHVTKTLLESDPDISIQDENGLTALFCAAQFGQFECLMCLIEYAESKGKIVEDIFNFITYCNTKIL